MLKFIVNKIREYVIKKTADNKLVDIVEVRTKEIGLTSVKTETDICIHNLFFLPISVLSIETDLLNRDGQKVGKLSYAHPIKIKRKENAILTTASEISIITSLFQALSSILSHPIKIQSVGIARLKFLWWTFKIPLNDAFEIHPSKVKIIKEESEEERMIRIQKEEERKIQHLEKKEKKAEERKTKRLERKEIRLKRIHKENYIPKEIREKQTDIELELSNNSEIISPVLNLEVEENIIPTIEKETANPGNNITEDLPKTISDVEEKKQES